MQTVLDALTQMSSGIRRCNYCEDSAGTQIEHVKPKSFCPENTYVWDNMLLACDWCNAPKNNSYAVFRSDNGRYEKGVRDANTGIQPPPRGESVLINPRETDPADYFHLDILDTFVIRIRPGLSHRDRFRARYTLTILHLNNRDALVERRANAYEDYVSRIERYISCRDGGEPKDKLDRIIKSIREADHRYVWSEMIRQRSGVSELNYLFSHAPEALLW